MSKEQLLPENIITHGFFESVFNAIQDSICIIKSDTFEIVYANNAFLTETGFKEGDILGKTCYSVTHHLDAPCSPPDHRCPLKEMLEARESHVTGEPFTFMPPIDHIHYNAAGEKIYVEVACHPVENGNPENPYIIHITRDITYRKQIEARLLEKTEELLKLNLSLKKKVDSEIQERLRQEDLLLHQSRLASLGSILGDLSHQWKQPLSTISILVQDLEDAYEYGEFNENYLKEFLKQSLSQIQFMTDSIEDFRLFFRPDRQKSNFNIIPALKDVLKLLEHQFKKQRIRTELILCSDTVIAEGFPNEFKHVVLNLLSNARDSVLEKRMNTGNSTADPASDDTITIQISDCEDHYDIHIDDTGMGILPENLHEAGGQEVPGRADPARYPRQLRDAQAIGSHVVAGAPERRA